MARALDQIAKGFNGLDATSGLAENIYWQVNDDGTISTRTSIDGSMTALGLAASSTLTTPAIVSPTVTGSPVGVAYASAISTYTHADLTDADDGDPQSFTIAVPAHTMVLGARCKSSVIFSGGTPVTLVLDVTLGGGPVITDYNLLTAVGDTHIGFNANGTGIFAAVSDATYDVTVTFEIDGANNLAALSGGSVDVQLVLIRLF